MLQRSRETNQGWLGIGAAVGAALNGAAMGAGFATRIGYWLWYVVPVTCFLLASPGAGALVFGLYGLARAAFPVALAVNDGCASATRTTVICTSFRTP